MIPASFKAGFFDLISHRSACKDVRTYWRPFGRHDYGQLTNSRYIPSFPANDRFGSRAFSQSPLTRDQSCCPTLLLRMGIDNGGLGCWNLSRLFVGLDVFVDPEQLRFWYGRHYAKVQTLSNADL